MTTGTTIAQLGAKAYQQTAQCKGPLRECGESLLIILVDFGESQIGRQTKGRQKDQFPILVGIGNGLSGCQRQRRDDTTGAQHFTCQNEQRRSGNSNQQAAQETVHKGMHDDDDSVVCEYMVLLMVGSAMCLTSTLVVEMSGTSTVVYTS